jgi:release factor glutamine methyltransferase
MSCPIKRTRFGNAIFDIYDDVYEPAEDSFLIAEQLAIRANEHVLDLGTGSGILAVLAAKKDSIVTAVDINPHALACAKHNCSLNNVEGKVGFVRGDLLTALNELALFDLILFNAPYLPSEEDEEATWIGRSWAGGANGRQVVDRFIAQVPQHLKLGGRILLLQSTLTGAEETLIAFGAHNLKARVKAKHNLPFFETLILIEAKADL